MCGIEKVLKYSYIWQPYPGLDSWSEQEFACYLPCLCGFPVGAQVFSEHWGFSRHHERTTDSFPVSALDQGSIQPVAIVFTG